MAFVSGSVDTLRSFFSHEGRLYAFGHSNGAALANRLAVNGAMDFHGVVCSATQLLSAPASSGPAPHNQNLPGSWSEPVTYLSLHGSDDQTIPAAGGALLVSQKAGVQLHSVAESTRLFAELNACLAAPDTSEVSSSIPGSQAASSTATVTRYRCGPTVPVEGYMVQGGGHGIAATIASTTLESSAVDFCDAWKRHTCKQARSFSGPDGLADRRFRIFVDRFVWLRSQRRR